MKKGILSIILATTFIASSCMTVCAAPQAMPDGGMFDAQYYAQSNPDVVAVFGTDENALYEHYKLCGQAEGRKSYEAEMVSDESATPGEFKTLKVPRKSDEYGKYGGILGMYYVSHDINGQLSLGIEEMVRCVMNYVIGGGGSKLSCTQTGPNDYTCYVYKEGVKYREDLHFVQDGWYTYLDTITYGVVGPATAEETAMIEERLKRNHVLTAQNGGGNDWQNRGFYSAEEYEEWYVENWVE